MLTQRCRRDGGVPLLPPDRLPAGLEKGTVGLFRGLWRNGQQLHCWKRDAETAFLRQRPHRRRVQCRYQPQAPTCSVPPAVKCQPPQLWLPEGPREEMSLAPTACARTRGEELCSPAAAFEAQRLRWLASRQPGFPPEPTGLERGQSHCPPPLCASPTRLAAAFLWHYCSQFCKEQEQNTVLALKNTADK